MRSPSAVTARLALGVSLLIRPALGAEPTATAGAPVSPTTEAARAHFKTGVKLYQDQNYAGALAEFEAAYSLKPGPGSLQNVALCQKALFRYGEAADSLARLLSEHGADLSATERNAAERAKAELEALVGPVRLEVTPHNATVTLDGLPFTAANGAARLNVGEHTFSASAPGFARATRSVSVASGQPELVVDLVLEPTARSADASAAEPTKSAAQAAPEAPAPPAPVKSSKPQLGFYGVGSASVFARSNPPFDFELSAAKSRSLALGVRGGWRFRPAVAVEGMLEYAAQSVDHACDGQRGALATPVVECGSKEAADLDVSYSIHAVRFGPNLALMTANPRLRALGTVGLGVVWHEFRCTGCSAGAEQKSRGTDGYVMLEAGVGANTRHAVMALTLQTIVEGTRNLISGRNLGGAEAPHQEKAYSSSGGALAYIGLNVRVGYSAWAP
ncbi:MAG TPA: hypothetical protein VGQ57_09480 [Polyangiaceae bacterium]|nr:hypothetical protein [Polyangiaceae bacterium]